MKVKRLKNTIKANAIFSSISGTLLILFPGVFADLMQVNNNLVFTIIGVGLILFVFLLIYVSTTKNINRNLVKLIIVQDWIWVLGSAILLLFNPFGISIYGNILIALIAVVVMLFAITQATNL